MGTRGQRPNEADKSQMIELEMLGTGPLPAPRPPPPNVSRPPPTRPHRGWWVVGAVVAVLAFIIAAAALDDGGGESEDVGPASTIARATAVAAPTTIPPVSTAPTTIPPVSTAPATTAGVSPGAGPVLGAPHGWTVVSFDLVTLRLLDLDTGATTRLDYDNRLPQATTSGIMLSDRFVYTDQFQFGDGPRSVWSQLYFNRAPPTLVQEDASIITPSSVPGRFWVALDQAGVNDGLLVAEIDDEGRRTTSLTIPNGLRVVGASSAGLWLSGGGRIYSLSRGGALLAIAVGTVIATSLAGVLYDDCAIAGPCTLRLAGANAQSARIGPSAEMPVPTTSDGSDSPLSPNGRWLLLENGLLDRLTGAHVGHSFLLRTWRWSPDGEWLFVMPANSDSVAWNLTEGRYVHLGQIGVLAAVVTR